MIISFCGHSDYLSNLEDEERLLKLFEKVIENRQVDFYLGGYGAFDNFALKCAKKYKKKYPTARLVFVTPYLGKWLNDRKEFLTKTYDEIVYPNLERTPPKFAISKRNEWMIKQSDFVFGYVSTHYGGAYNSLLFAKRHKKSYMNLYQGDYDLY